ncbi:glycosyltransferase family 9 protein [Pedobacter deserti]|uniref:glycosyltransferase family 9 protein n=1 Tax=Pedobacter deserti TaxID=2817382 RepID=UPI00210E1AF6|nr:glycosyltransferase family 9 protein [Pedobacter sp. SYSU D00382]
MTPEEPHVQSIGIFRALQLGDILCSIPAIRALRHAFPQAKITFIGLPWTADIIARFPAYIDEFMDFPGYPGLPEQPFDDVNFKHFLLATRARHFDLLLQMQGSGSIVNNLLATFGAKQLAGFCEQEPGTSANFLLYPDSIHEVHRHLALMTHLGIPLYGDELEFPLHEADFAAIEPWKLARPYICVHPGSRGNWRQWPPQHFASVADRCAELGYQIVITGTANERSIAEEISGLMANPATITSGETSLGGVAALISRSSGLIANCTGVSHIAAALKKQSVIISMDGEPNRWAPLNKELHKTIDWTVTPDYALVLNEVCKVFPPVS